MKLNYKMARCNLSNLSQLEHNLFLHIHRKEVDFEDGKVLVSRLGDKIHATSAFCTHYGAPLAKGVLTSDGRVVWCVNRSLSSLVIDPYCSPWHGGKVDLV
jgi:nitrite reductase/ring-hydroxylating ferredoxin subunit